MKKKLLLMTTVLLFSILFVNYAQAAWTWCCLPVGGNCDCNAGGSCSYDCMDNWFNDDGIITTGCENAAPRWLYNQANNTNPQIRDAVSFKVNWTDTTGTNETSGLGISHTILSLKIDGPNCDQWINVSTVDRGGPCTGNVNCGASVDHCGECGCDGLIPPPPLPPACTGNALCSYLDKSTCSLCSNCSWYPKSIWSNITYSIPDKCAGKTIYWKQYTNDTANRWNVTSDQSITVRKGWLNVTLLDPNPLVCNETNPCDWCAYLVKDMSAKVECKDYRCGFVNATARRNSTGINMVPININGDNEPFHILQTMLRPMSFSIYKTGSGSNGPYPNQSYDNNPNDTDSFFDILALMTLGSVRVNYTYLLSNTSATLFLTSDSSGNERKIQIYNFTNNNWYTWLSGFSEQLTTYGIKVNTSSGLVSSNGILILSPYINGTNVGMDIYDTYVSYLGNNVIVSDFAVGDSRNIWWKINVSSCIPTNWKVDTLFTSTSLVENKTKNATIRVSPGTSINDIKFNKTDNFNFQIYDTINCAANVTDPKNKTLYVYYNISDPFRDHFYSGVLYNKSLASNPNCTGDNNWVNGETCTATVPNVFGHKGNWTCKITVECVCGLVYSTVNATMINTPPPKSNINEPKNETWFNKYQTPIKINCTNTTPEKNIEDSLKFDIWWIDPFNQDWHPISGCSSGVCYWSPSISVIDNDTYKIRCMINDSTNWIYADDIIVKLDRTPPTCILNATNIIENPYLLNGTYWDILTGMSNVTYKYFNGTDWKFIGTNSTANYTWNWDVLNENPSLENKWIYINATCNDTIGNDFTNQSRVAVDLVDESPSIWNLVVRDTNDDTITHTITGVSVRITVNASDPDPVRNINYVTGNFIWPNGTIALQNLTIYETSNYNYNWTYNIPYSMPYSNPLPNASIKVTAYDQYSPSDQFTDQYVYKNWNFSTASQITGYPMGIAYNGTHFWAVRYNPPTVFRYNKTGDYDGFNFSCSGQDSYLQGIDVNETHIFVVGSGNKSVYIYDMVGNYKKGFSVSQTSTPTSVVYNGTYFWVLSSGTNKKVYRYKADGTNDNWNFNYLISGKSNAIGNGLEFNGTHFFISDIYSGGWVYAYNSTGNYTGWNFTTNTSIKLGSIWGGAVPYGLAYSENEKNFYTIDYQSGDKYVRKYERNQTSMSSMLSNSTNTTLIIVKTAVLSFLTYPIDFDIVPAGSQVNATYNKGWPLSMVIRGNTPINLSQNGTDLRGNNNPNLKIGVGNVSWNITNNTVIWTNLTTQYTRIENNVMPDTNESIYYRLRIPVIEPQYYSGNVSIKGGED